MRKIECTHHSTLHQKITAKHPKRAPTPLSFFFLPLPRNPPQLFRKLTESFSFAFLLDVDSGIVQYISTFRHHHRSNWSMNMTTKRIRLSKKSTATPCFLSLLHLTSSHFTSSIPLLSNTTTRPELDRMRAATTCSEEVECFDVERAEIVEWSLCRSRARNK